jgi:hypothetical protein
VLEAVEVIRVCLDGGGEALLVLLFQEGKTHVGDLFPVLRYLRNLPNFFLVTLSTNGFLHFS